MESKVSIELIKKRLTEEIDASGVKYVDLAKQVGISSNMFTEYKTTKKMPSLETFAKICEVLDLDVNYVLGLKDV